MKRIIIELQEDDIDKINEFMKGKRTKREMIRANVLLLLHRGKTEKDISDFLDTDYKTVWCVKTKFLKN